MTQENVTFPSKLKPLFEAFRYKIMYGGRGGAKSWGAARAVITMGTERPLRVLCAREVMKSVKESVYQLLKDQIGSLGLEDFYEVLSNEIRGANGTQITFSGLRTLTAANIKSYEGVDICWCEEAQNISAPSWELLIPTIRKEHSEIWLTFNPELDTDATYIRFVQNSPPESVKIEINWRDNPWFPKTLEMERAYSQEHDDPETYEHVWEGRPRTTLAGAIFANEVRNMIREQRYREAPPDPRLPVHTIWDLGWNDQTSVVLVQRIRNEVTVVDYLEASFLTLADWVKVLDKLPYKYGTDWLPWDGGIIRQQTGLSDKKILRGLGRKSVKVIGQHGKEDRIQATRIMLPRTYINATNDAIMEVGEIRVRRGGARLLECLKRFRRKVPTTTGDPTGPVHDEFSHGADAFGGVAMIVDKMDNEYTARPVELEQWGQAVEGVM